MRLTRMVRNDALAKLLENPVEGRRRLGRRGIKKLPRGGSVQRAIRRLVAQRREVFGHEIGDLTPDALHRRVVELQ